MELIRIYCLCPLVVVFANSRLLHLLPIEQLITQIYARQVLFLNRGEHQKQQSEPLEQIENWVYSRFASRLPCVWIDIDEDDRVPILLKESKSFFLYVGLEEDVKANFVKSLKGLTMNFHAPIRVLLIILDGKNDSSTGYLDLLQQFWQEQLIDVTIIGVTSKRVSKRRRKIAMTDRETDYAATIHHYNPFAGVYTKRALDSASRLFPAKLDDLHGLKLRVGLVDNPPYSWRSWKSRRIMGHFGMLMELIQRKMNFSVEVDSRPMLGLGVLLSNGSATGLLGEIAAPQPRLDVVAYASFLFHVDHPLPVDRTTFITLEPICGLVPLMRRPAFQLNSGIQWSLLVILGLVVVVWLSSRLLLGRDGASSRLLATWGPLDIGLLMMGSSIPARVVTLRERILFGCVLMAASFYSSSILAHLTRLNLDLDAYVRFKTYRELDESGLVPFLHPNLMNITFRFSDDPSLNRLGAKALQHTDTDTCLGWLLSHANVSCIMGQLRNSYLLERHSDRMKQAEPCFWTAYRAFIVRKGSPYTPSFDRIIRVVQEARFDHSWALLYRAEVAKSRNDSSASLDGDEDDDEANVLSDSLRDNSYRSVFFLLLAGYVMSLAFFIAELIVKHFQAKLRSRWQRLRPRKTISMD